MPYLRTAEICFEHARGALLLIAEHRLVAVVVRALRGNPVAIPAVNSQPRGLWEGRGQGVIVRHGRALRVLRPQAVAGVRARRVAPRGRALPGLLDGG